MDGRDGTWSGQGSESGVRDERVYREAFARVERENRSRSWSMLSSDPDEIVLRFGSPDARVCAQMEDGGRKFYHSEEVN